MMGTPGHGGGAARQFWPGGMTRYRSSSGCSSSESRPFGDRPQGLGHDQNDEVGVAAGPGHPFGHRGDSVSDEVEDAGGEVPGRGGSPGGHGLRCRAAQAASPPCASPGGRPLPQIAPNGSSTVMSGGRRVPGAAWCRAEQRRGRRRRKGVDLMPDHPTDAAYTLGHHAAMQASYAVLRGEPVLCAQGAARGKDGGSAPPARSVET